MKTTKGGRPQNSTFASARAVLLSAAPFLYAVAMLPSALAAPRSSCAGLIPDSSPPLYRESFDETFAWGATSAQSVLGNYTLNESWSGYALQRSGARVTPFYVPGVDATGRTNVNPAQGTIRFWVKPTAWSSPTQTKDTGPGAVATLLELDAIGKGESANLWSLQISADGTALSLVAQSDSQPTLLLQSEISWPANQSHLIVLNYGPKETALFIDGQPVAQGAGTLAVSPQMAALFVGSSLAGKSVAGGDFDELFCFDASPPRWWRSARPMAATEILFYYNALSAEAALGPISAEEIAARASRIAAMKTLAVSSKSTLSLADTGMEAMAMRGTYGPLSECVTNVPVCMTNVWAGFEASGTMAVTFDVVGGTNGFIYDVFGTTNLAGSQWFWVTNTPTCNTVALPGQADAQTFYLLGGPQDSDHDGLTDAYELLISHTDPNNSDSDGDGIPDGWAVYLGLNPNGNALGQPGLRANFSYTLADWLDGVSGVRSGGVSADAEGNVLSVSQ